MDLFGQCGWNRLWEGPTVYSWYGSVVTSFSLRLVAMEWWAFVPQAYQARCQLNSLLNQETDLSTIPPPIVHFLRDWGIIREVKTGKPLRNFVRRINFDTRELPFIERWKWSGEWGWAYLSDEDMVQVSLTAAWARSLEPLLNPCQSLSSPFLSTLSPIGRTSSRNDGSPVVIIPITSDEKMWARRVVFYGLGEFWDEGVHLLIPFTSSMAKLTRMVVERDLIKRG